MESPLQTLYEHSGESIISRTASFISKIRRSPSAEIQEEYKDIQLGEGEQLAEEVEAPIYLGSKSAFLKKEDELNEADSSDFKEEILFDSTWFSVDKVCSSFKDINSRTKCKSVLDDASIRVRKAEIDGEIKYEWTLKLKETNVDGIRKRPEIEGYGTTNAEAHIRLAHGINEELRIKGSGISITVDQITNQSKKDEDLHVVKTRRTYEFKSPKVKEGAKCFGTKIDMDIITQVNHKKLKGDDIIYALDVEGPNEDQIKHCAKCIGLKIDPDFDLFALFVERGYAKPRK